MFSKFIRWISYRPSYNQPLVKKVPYWNRIITPKPVVENTNVSIHWDTPIYSEDKYYITEKREIDQIQWFTVMSRRKSSSLNLVDPRLPNREIKFTEKQEKYQEVRKELKERNSGYEIEQINVIVDVLGGYSEYSVRSSLLTYLGKFEAVKVLNKIQRAVLFGSIRMKNLFKSTVNATA